MLKHDYLVPETRVILVEDEKAFCQSGTGSTTSSFENFDSEDTDFPMF